jgi:hypothetical protein
MTPFPEDASPRHKVVTIGSRFIFSVRLEAGDGSYLPDHGPHYSNTNGGGFDSFGFGGGGDS